MKETSATGNALLMPLAVEQARALLEQASQTLMMLDDCGITCTARLIKLSEKAQRLEQTLPTVRAVGLLGDISAEFAGILKGQSIIDVFSVGIEAEQLALSKLVSATFTLRFIKRREHEKLEQLEPSNTLTYGDRNRLNTILNDMRNLATEFDLILSDTEFEAENRITNRVLVEVNQNSTQLVRKVTEVLDAKPTH